MPCRDICSCDDGREIEVEENGFRNSMYDVDFQCVAINS